MCTLTWRQLQLQSFGTSSPRPCGLEAGHSDEAAATVDGIHALWRDALAWLVRTGDAASEKLGITVESGYGPQARAPETSSCSSVRWLLP